MTPVPDRPTPAAVGVVGPSDAGKTTLIERLLPRLRERGRVATVKSIHHDVDFDRAGTDTHRHRVAGADRVVGASPSLTFSVTREGTDHHEGGRTGFLEDLLGRLAADGYDFVLVEGFSSSPLPKLVVGNGREFDGRVLARIDDPDRFDPDQVVALISDLGEAAASG